MKTVLKGLAAAAVTAAVFALPAQAQTRTFSLGLHGGYLNTGSLAEAEPSDVDLKLDNGDVWGGGLEWWLGSKRLGLRFDGAYASNPWAIETGLDNGTFDNENYERLEEFGQVDTWFADADLMLRLFRPERDRRFAPFISLGTGLMHWDHEGENVDLELEDADAYIYGEDQTEWAVTGSVGTDFFFSPSVALRLEVKDYYNTDSPYLMLSDMERDHEGGHNLSYRAGLQFFFGGGEVEEPGFVAPEPEPEPEPMPEPEPEIETVSMCVVTDDYGVEIVQASRVVGTNRIFVMRNGREVAFNTAYPVSEPLYVRSARWYVADQPLVVDLASEDYGDVDDELDDAIENRIEAEDYEANRFEFVRFGTPTRMAANDMMFVGTIDGTPLWARTSEVGMLRTELQNRLRVTSELDEILDDEDFAERFANQITTFYTAVEPAEANCVFQPISTTHVVRRTRG